MTQLQLHDLLPDQEELDTLMADDLLPCTAENKDTWRNWHKSFGRKVRVASGLRDLDRHKRSVACHKSLNVYCAPSLGTSDV